MEIAMEEVSVKKSAEKEFAQVLADLAAENSLSALGHIEKALRLRDAPEWYSYLGYCIAKERGQHRKGLELCQESLAVEPDNPAHFLNLGRIHLAKGEKAEALRIWREGMAKGGSPELVQQLERLGTRSRPALPTLARKNPLNRYLGILLTRLGLR
jgi:tetratricopeptide (TPR) repeat protein